MHHKIRNQSRSQDFSTAKFHKHMTQDHTKIPTKNSYDDEDYYSHASQSHSSYESNEDEFGKSLDNEDASYIESEPETNAQSDQFSLPKSVPKTNNSTALIGSALNNPPILVQANTHSYMNIAPLPLFHGTANECPITHLSRFTKVCRANNVSDIMMRIFPVTLDNEAALWYDLNIEPYPSVSWEEIKSSFLEAYHKIELRDQLGYELMMLNQGSDESVRSYFLRLQWILKKFPGHGITETLLKGIFVDGLREDFQDWIVPQKPDSLNEAMELAFSFEQVKSIRGAARGKELIKCGFCEEGHEEKDCEVRERMRELWRKYCKDKQGMCSLEKIGRDDLVLKETGESSSSVVLVKNEKKEDEGGLLLGREKKSQCQCWKHQCGKKQLERQSTSVLTRNSSSKNLDRNYTTVLTRNSVAD